MKLNFLVLTSLVELLSAKAEIVATRVASLGDKNEKAKCMQGKPEIHPYPRILVNLSGLEIWDKENN